MPKLKVEYVPIEKLKLNPRNPRIASETAITAIKRSIEKFGWTNPVLVQKSTDMVIAGHQRIKAAKLAGLKEIPVIFLDLDDTKSLAYNIADNKLAELTDWDTEKLSGLLSELKTEMDLSLLGFNESDLTKLLKQSASDKELTVNEIFEVVIDCSDEEEQKKTFDELTKLGYKCKVLIL